jgi:hypothetical protein
MVTAFFRDENIDLELFDEVVEGSLDLFAMLVKGAGELGWTDPIGETRLVRLAHFRLLKVKVRRHHAHLVGSIELSSEVVAVTIVALEDVRPLLGLEGYAVGTGNPKGNEAHVFVHAASVRPPGEWRNYKCRLSSSMATVAGARRKMSVIDSV